MTEKNIDMIEAMEKYGGSFVKSLSQCLLHADSTNYQILIKAFPAYVKEYEDMAKGKKD